MLGHVAQSLGAALPAVAREAKAAQFFTHLLSSATTWTAPADGIVTLRLTGAGGGGTNGTNHGGGAGGGFLQRRVRIRKGQVITGIVAGAAGAAGASGAAAGAGGDTVCTLPDGSVLRARGGQGATVGTATIAQGGTATGGDVNNVGGAGGKRTIASAQKGGGTFGGEPSAASSSDLGRKGGGPAGPDEFFPRPSGGGGFNAVGISGGVSALPGYGGGGGGDPSSTSQQPGGSGIFDLEFVPS